MQNEIYDMDEKKCFSYGSISSPSSQSSYTSGYSSSSNMPPISLQRYDDISTYNTAFNMSPASVFGGGPDNFIQTNHLNPTNDGTITTGGYNSYLVILEQPAEKFRFRYKSEMHGTHGSLNGSRSEKNKKTFPEVELKNFNGVGIIRCSLYQTTDKPSPHSHQLVVRKDDNDERDPHDLRVSPEKGYIARFENMGIIHTAKKNICEELYSKKKQKLKFETGCERLSQRQEKILRDEAEAEAKTMNLNQVRLCFEAFEIVNEGSWKRICEPVFSKPINNRKSALTGELKICRMSTVVGSAAGGEDIILLVEKVSKKNIQVRFFELVDEDVVWEAYGDFSDADVHHQYAIVVRTPPYKNKDIDTNVNVFIELVRKSDDERSAPLGFRYKPRDIILSRKRRRTSYNSTASSPVSSSELPKPITEGMQQHMQHQVPTFQMAQQQPPQQYNYQQQRISEEFNKDATLKTFFEPNPLYHVDINCFLQKIACDSGELKDIAFTREHYPDILQTDGTGEVLDRKRQSQHLKLNNLKSVFKHLFAIYNNDELSTEKKRADIQNIIEESFGSENGDTIIHELVKQNELTIAIGLMNFLSELKLNELLSQPNNRGETPLHTACLYDQHAYIRPLLKRSCDPNIQDRDGNTALHIAVNENLTHCLNSFVSFFENNTTTANLNVNLANDMGLTPLHLAIRRNLVNITAILLKKFNASSKIACSCDGNNALHLAVQYQNPEMVKTILNNSDVKLNSKNQSGHTAVDLANTLEGSMKQEILNLLLEHAPSSNSSDASSPSPLEKTNSNSTIDEQEDISSSEDDDQKPNITELEEQTREVHMKHTLQRQEVQNRLAQVLKVDNKWKKLASILKLDHMLLVWVSVEPMLQYILRQADEIGILKIVDAILSVDPKTIDIIDPPEKDISKKVSC